RRGDPEQGAPRAHGPHRPGDSGRAHLVPQEPAVAHRHGPRSHLEGDREGPLLRVLPRRGPEGCRAEMGAEAIRELLQGIDVESLAKELRDEIRQATSEAKRKKLAK